MRSPRFRPGKVEYLWDLMRREGREDFEGFGKRAGTVAREEATHFRIDFDDFFGEGLIFIGGLGLGLGVRVGVGVILSGVCGFVRGDLFEDEFG